MKPIVVAGHLCLDVIPELPRLDGFEPGRLVEAGRAVLATGGAVSNTGQSLHVLGNEVRLVGKVGDDPFADIVRRLLRDRDPRLADGLTVAPGEATSYTVVLNLRGHDRMFLHHPGCNDTFVADDVPDAVLDGAGHLHFGYPPLMARMYADEGAELVSLFRRVRGEGLTTSLDLSLPDRDSVSGHAPWARVLELTLPFVDVFTPSLDEIAFMLGAGDERYLGAKCVEMGARLVAIKLGDRGLYVTDGRAEWREPCFRVEVAGATGSGDATIAGFLHAWLRGRDPGECALAGVAVGAFCCEAADATSGVRPWPEVAARYAAGWERLTS